SVASYLEVVEADFLLRVLEAPFDVPTSEGDGEQGGDRRLQRSVREEVLQLAVERALRDDEEEPLRGVPARDEYGAARMPDEWALRRLLDLVRRPRRSTPLPEILYAAVLLRQARLVRRPAADVPRH